MLIISVGYPSIGLNYKFKQVVLFLGRGKTIKSFEEVVCKIFYFFCVSFLQGFRVTDFRYILKQPKEFFHVLWEFDAFFPLGVDFIFIIGFDFRTERRIVSSAKASVGSHE